jgi:hypothetical protein
MAFSTTTYQAYATCHWPDLTINRMSLVTEGLTVYVLNLPLAMVIENKRICIINPLAVTKPKILTVI